VLGPILFIIYMNDLCFSKFHGSLTAFADDTAFLYISDTLASLKKDMEDDLTNIQFWLWDNKMFLNVTKTKYMLFSLRGSLDLPIRVKIHDQCNTSSDRCSCVELEKVDTFKYLGVLLDSQLSWKSHVNKLRQSLSCFLRKFYYLKNICPQHVVKNIYCALVHSRLTYGICCWGGTYVSHLKPLITLEKFYIRILLSKMRYHRSFPLFQQLNYLPLRHFYIFKVLKVFYNKSGEYGKPNLRSLRNNHNFLSVPLAKKEIFNKFISVLYPRFFNHLPDRIKLIINKRVFLKNVKTWLLEKEHVESVYQPQYI
jgi:hypothetical protein